MPDHHILTMTHRWCNLLDLLWQHAETMIDAPAIRDALPHHYGRVAPASASRLIRSDVRNLRALGFRITSSVHGYQIHGDQRPSAD